MGNAASFGQAGEATYAAREVETDRETNSGTQPTETELVERGEVKEETNRKSQFRGKVLPSVNSLES